MYLFVAICCSGSLDVTSLCRFGVAYGSTWGIAVTELPFGAYAKRGYWKYRFRGLTRFKAIPGVIRAFIKRYPLSLVSDVEVDGVKFRCYPGQNVHDRLFFHNEIFVSEKEEFQFLLSHAVNADCVVDIGANTGSICISLAAKAPSIKRIVAIEPDPLNLERLRFNAAINHVSNIEVVNCAVADHEGEMKLWRKSQRNLGQNSLHKLGNGSTSVTVRIKPLIDILKSLNVERIDVLKIDIEGFEDRALVPFFQVADRTLWPKAILIEHSGASLWEKDCLSLMTSLGYEVKGRNADNTFLSLPTSLPN
jgi:FkbM family methyltransferase